MNQKRYYFKIDVISRDELNDLKKSISSFDIWAEQVKDREIKNIPDPDDFVDNFEIDDMRIFIVSCIINGKKSRPKRNHRTFTIYGYSSTPDFANYKKKIKKHLKNTKYKIKDMKALCLFINKHDEKSCEVIEYSPLTFGQKINKLFLIVLSTLLIISIFVCVLLSVVLKKFESVSFGICISIFMALLVEFLSWFVPKDNVKLDSIVSAVEFSFKKENDDEFVDPTILKGR